MRNLVLFVKKGNNITRFWKRDKIAFQCKECGYRTALTSGSALEKKSLTVFILVQSNFNVVGDINLRVTMNINAI